MSQPKKEKYQKLSDVEQILHRPDMYMGSIKTQQTPMYIFDEQQGKMIFHNLDFNSGLLKIFDEVITNAQDQAIRTQKEKKKTKNIYVQINKQSGIIDVTNDGPSIDISKHKTEKIPTPQLIFGNLRTSSNYDDTDIDRRVGGLNGLGVKLTNIYSKKIWIDIVYQGKRYQQLFENNMGTTNTPEITQLENKKDNPEYVKVSFLPDYQRFGMKSLTDDMYKIFIKRIYDCAGSCCKYISTHFNGQKINIKSFKEYCNLYLPSNTYELLIDQPKETIDIKLKNKLYQQSQELKDDTQIIVAQSDGNFRQISFVNNVFTIQGGKHVDYIMSEFIDKISSSLKKKRGNKDLRISNSYIKENISIFLNMHVYQPTFSSQAKDHFSSDYTSWGYVPIIEDKFIEKIIKSPIGQSIMERITQANDKPITKNDGKKKKNVGFIDGLVDATKAGTSESSKCTLFLVEGKSAAQLVISGRSQIPNGVDYYGVFALRGKVLNVKDASQKQIAANNEITQIKQILGLQQGKVYKDASELRYGKILIATDADSVLGDTPILLKKNGQIQIQTIERIGKNFQSEDIYGKEYGDPDGYECWTDEGWQQIIHVMKHKTNKKMFRVLTHTGVVDVSEDHSLLLQNKEKISPNQLKCDEKLLHNFPNFLDNKLNIPQNLQNLNKNKELNQLGTQFKISKAHLLNKNELIHEILQISQSMQYINLQNNSEQITVDEAYIMGVFFGDGHCSLRTVPNKQRIKNNEYQYYLHQVWSIANNDLTLLHKLQNLCKKVYGINTDFKIIKANNMENCNNKNIQQKYRLHMNGGKKVQHIVKRYLDLFYYKNEDSKYIQGNKFISWQILNQPFDIRQSFMTGIYSADGKHHDMLNAPKLRMDIESKISAQSVYYLCQSIGYNVSINLRSNKQSVYRLNICKKYMKQNPNTVKQIIDLGTTEQYVYDLETQNHRFQAGVGSCIVSNTDGYHCSMLASNIFQTIWPSLLKFEPNTFINRFLTPIIIATKKSQNKKEDQQIDFYTQQDFDNWFQQNEQHINRWKVKYFKGLAVFDQNSGKRHFKNMKVMGYHWQPEDDQYFTLAFDKQKAADRKRWLQNYDKDLILNYNETNTTFTELINKELIHFSVDDVARSICSLMDGLKPSQRKILYSCFKRKLWNDELRVAQLAGYCSEVSSYSHGESSLQGAIVQMAQDFVGSNNINLLLPNGQFGTRYDPKASGAPRYIHTQLNSIVKLLMNQDDNAILNYLKDDEDMPIEPEYYLPIIPMALVNGCVGIGTGFSTKIPSYNPLDIIHNLQILLQQEKSGKKQNTKFKELIPFYRGFRGQILVLDNFQSSKSQTNSIVDDDDYNDDNNDGDYEDTAQSAGQTSEPIYKYVSIGQFNRTGKSKIEVTEIPIGKSIKSFVENIQINYKDTEVIQDIRDDEFSLKIDFQKQDIVDKLMSNETNKQYSRIYKDLKLMDTGSIGTTNMYMFNNEGKITKYHSPMEVIQSFFQPRLKYYQTRKDYVLSQLELDIFVLSQKARFIMDIINGDLDLRNKKYQIVIKELLKNNYNPLDNKNQPVRNIQSFKKDQQIPNNYSYDFLTEMPLSSQTLEKKEQLLKQLDEKKQKYDQIKETHITDMWNQELELLKKKLNPSFQQN